MSNTILAATWAPVWESLRQFWPVALVSFFVSLLATPACRRIALKYGIVDRPDDFLKPHGRPIPYLGGVATCLGWLAGILIALTLSDIQLHPRIIWGIALAGVVTMLIGLFDDLRVMSPGVKLVSNVAVAVFLLWLGLGDELVNVLTHFTGMRFGPGERWLELAYSVPVAMLIVVGSLNATNLIDGLDGLCTGVLGIISIGFFILAAHLRISHPGVDLRGGMADERIVLSLAMLGAAVGFLPFNLNPAKIFLGDAGSMLLGLNAAILILLFGQVQVTRWLIGALMVFGLPIADMCLTLVRRWRNGRPLMQGDRSHFYDQLRDRGLTVRQVVAVSYLLTLAFVLMGISVLFIRTRYAILAYFVTVLVVILAIWKFDMVSIEGRSTGKDESRSKEPHGAHHS